MRTKLATLEVWTEDEPMFSFSRFNPTERHGTIVVSTKGESGMTPYKSPDEMKDVLAHELGHFLGYALNVPEQYVAGDSRTKLMADVFGFNPPEVIAAEVQAWDTAEKIRPVDPATRDKYLDTYRKS